jgi:hypothetical protein
VHLRCNHFQLHVPPLQQLTITDPLYEVIAGTHRRRSSASQASRSTIQVLLSRMVSILEPVNHEEQDIILGTTIGVRLNRRSSMKKRLYNAAGSRRRHLHTSEPPKRRQETS